MPEQSNAQQRKRVPDCPRCGWKDRPGHGCTRYWGVKSFGVSRSGFAQNGKLTRTYWALHWSWRGDVHKYLPGFSLGDHINVSERARADAREEQLMREYYEYAKEALDGRPTA